VRNNPVTGTDPSGRRLRYGDRSKFGLQRELIGMVNPGLHGEALQITPSGQARMVPTNVQGPPSQEQASAAKTLHDAIDSTGDINIGLTSNSPGVSGGSWDASTIDIGDVKQFPTDKGTTQLGVIIHETKEQTLKQEGEPDYHKAHTSAMQAEGAATGQTRVPDDHPQASNGTLTTETSYLDKNGNQTTQHTEWVNGNISCTYQKDK
jgi:hypothetical protein